MNITIKTNFRTLRIFRTSTLILLVASLMGCSLWGSETKKYRPAELGENVPVLPVHQAWVVQLGSDIAEQLVPHVQNTTVTLASANGVVIAIDAITGNNVWRLDLSEPLIAGAGSDGLRTAVISRKNELIVLEGGREKWRKRLTAQVYTSPFIAGNRIFVLSTDRTIVAFDAANGHRLWTQSRPGEALILRQPGVLMSVNDTLLASFSGRLVGINPDSGIEKWEMSVAIPRGTNDVDRLVELVSPVSRLGYSLCMRAFQAAIGCVNTNNQTIQWIRNSSGVQGIDGDEKIIYGTQSNGTVTAWNRKDGSKIWISEHLQYRKLTAPILLGRSVVVGDDSGLVHFLSRENGLPLNRLVTDGSGIDMLPLAAADTLVVVTKKGNIYGFRPN